MIPTIAPCGMNCELCHSFQNLTYIREYGETAFLQQQKDKYTCPQCGKLHTVHYDYCLYCKQEKTTKRRLNKT